MGFRTTLDEYAERYQHVAFRREGGIIEVRLHSDNGPLVWGDGPHSELGSCFSDISRDPDNRVMIITGTGDSFIERIDASWVGPMSAEKWTTIHMNGIRLIEDLLSIRIPVIAAVNGPARVHSELAVLSDITLAATTAVFQDAPHFRRDTVPGDGVSLIWMTLLGPNRGRYFLLTGERLDAFRARDLGVVNEVLEPDQVVPRAWELAAQLCRQADTTLRFTRILLTQRLRELMTSHVALGLALEGLNAQDTWPSSIEPAMGSNSHG